jgi:saccharopine dehydrogenase (NAD+, L-lysine forming)
MSLHFWLRAEDKAMEERAPLVPADAAKLLQAGHRVTVEPDPRRAFPVDEYERAGCKTAPAHAWRNAAADTVILGLKELAEEPWPLVHRHVYFAHAYKNQQGWKGVLRRFGEGKGALFDLEYLTDESGRRVVAFGHWAGVVGAALGVELWSHQKLNPAQPMPAVKSFPSQKAMAEHASESLKRAMAAGAPRPRSIILGAKGRCGQGAAEMLGMCGGLDATLWDLAETAKGGPFEEILDHDLFINAVFVQSKIPPFITPEMLPRRKRLTALVDVSCDINNPANPIPIYQRHTDFDAPAMRIADAPVLDVVAIDHLPSLLPRESSAMFSSLLVQHLLDFEKGSGVWSRAEALFNEKLRQASAP